MAKTCPLIFGTPLSCLIFSQVRSRGTLVMAVADSWFHQKYPSWSLLQLVSPCQQTPCIMPCTLCLQQKPCRLLQSCVERSCRSCQQDIRGACKLNCVVLMVHARERSFQQIATTWTSCVQEYHLHGRTSSSRLKHPGSMVRSLERRWNPPHRCLGMIKHRPKRRRKYTP